MWNNKQIQVPPQGIELKIKKTKQNKIKNHITIFAKN